MSYNKWTEACLLCGTSTSTNQLPNKDQVKLTEAFCELYEIDTQLEEVWSTVQFAFYCPNCRAELLFIHEFQTLRQSGVGRQENKNDSIGKLRSRLKTIQLQQQEKLQKFLDTLISAGTGTGTGNPEDETDHDQIWEEIMKRKQLLICMELLQDLGPVSSPEPELEPEPEPEKDNPVPNPNDAESLPSPSHAPLNSNQRPPSASISTQKPQYLNKNDQDIESTATNSVVADVDAVDAPNSALNTDRDSSWEDILDEGQDGSYPADHDDHISNSELDLDADVDVDVKPEIEIPPDFDPVADSGMKIIAVESLNNTIISDEAHFRLHPKSARATDTELVKEKNVLKEWKRRFNLKEFSIKIKRIHLPTQEKEAAAESETVSVIITAELNPKPTENQDLYSSLCKSVANKKREIAKSASLTSALSNTKSKSPSVKNAVLQPDCDSSRSNSDARKNYELTLQSEKIGAIPIASNEEVEAEVVESAAEDENLTLLCTWKDCAEEFKTEKKRVEHIRRFHEGFKKPFPCETCGKSTHSYNRYLDHQNLHLGLTPHECLMPGCKRSFHTSDQRREHMRGAQHKTELGIKQNLTAVRSNKNAPEIPENFAELKRLHNVKELSINLRRLNPKPDNSTPTKEKEQRTRSGRLVKKTIKTQEVITVEDEEPIKSNKTVGDRDELFDGDETENYEDDHSHNRAVDLSSATDSESDFDIMDAKMDILRKKIRRRKQFNSKKRTKDTFKIKFDNHSKSKTKSKRAFTRTNVCDTCSRAFPTAKILADHQNTHKNLTPYHCPEPGCPYKNAMERNLLVHSRVHQSPQYQCKETDCGRYFRDLNCYRDHTASHKAEREPDAESTKQDHVYKVRPQEAGDFKCDKCPKTFTLQATYARHILTHDEDCVRLNLTCHSCDQVFSDRETVDQHEQDVHPEKCIFKCEYANCKFSTPRATRLRWHVFTHPNFNPRTTRGPRQTHFKCPMDNCPYFSRTAGALKGHMARRHTDATPFECKFCHRNFKTLDYLKVHIKIVHLATKDHVCNVCGKTFSQRRYLTNHVETHKGVKSIMCDLCGLGFSAQSDLFKHKREQHLDPDPDAGNENNTDDSKPKTKSKRNLGPPNRTKYICDICSRGFSSAKVLADHQNKHKNLTPYHCPEPNCPYKTASEQKLKGHRRVHKLPKYKCTETDCGKYFRGLKCYRDHLASHKVDAGSTKTKQDTLRVKVPRIKVSRKKAPRKKVPRENVPREYVPQENVPRENVPRRKVPRRKVPRPETVTEYKCRTCGRRYLSQTKLNTHYRKIHVYKMKPKNAQNFKCDQCLKTFTVQSSYTRHILTHDKDYVRDNLTCHICEKVFGHKETCEVHEQKFHPEKCIFKCEQDNCQFSTSRETKLKRHVTVVHLSLNPRTRSGPAKGPRKTHFKCPIENCPYVARFSGHLNIHLTRRHTEATPFECKFCHRKYKTLDYLKTHIKFVHAATKDHVCSVCGKAFSHRRYLTNHEESHKEVKSIMCDLCGLGFSLQSGLFKHKRRHHPADPGTNDSDPPSKPDIAQQSSETPRNSQKPKKESYPCKFCTQIFSRERFLALHKRREHAEKHKFQCEQCTFGCLRLNALEKHMQEKHTVGRPFKCDICGVGFNNPKWLVRHKELTHPPELKFHCTTCGKKFANKRYLEDHQLFKHMQRKAKVNPSGRPRRQAQEENSLAESNGPSNSNSHDVKAPKYKIKTNASSGRSPSLRKRKSKQVDEENQMPQLFVGKAECEKPEDSHQIETVELAPNLEAYDIFVPPQETPTTGIQNTTQNIFTDTLPEPEEFMNFGFQYNYI